MYSKSINGVETCPVTVLDIIDVFDVNYCVKICPESISNRDSEF